MIAHLRSWSILMIMGMGWGLTFSLSRIAAVGGVCPLSITFWQAMIGAALLMAVSSRADNPGSCLRLIGSDRRRSFVGGGLR